MITLALITNIIYYGINSLHKRSVWWYIKLVMKTVWWPHYICCICIVRYKSYHLFSHDSSMRPLWSVWQMVSSNYLEWSKSTLLSSNLYSIVHTTLYKLIIIDQYIQIMYFINLDSYHDNNVKTTVVIVSVVS